MNRRTFLTALAGLPLVGKMIPSTPLLAKDFQSYTAPAGTPFPNINDPIPEDWNSVGLYVKGVKCKPGTFTGTFS